MEYDQRLCALPLRILLFSLLCALLLLPTSTSALSAGEVIGLKAMQSEWGAQLDWNGSPSCSWSGISCDAAGNVDQMCVYLFWLTLFTFHTHRFDHFCPNSLCYYLVSSVLFAKHLSGTIPNSIGNFFALGSLYVS